MIAASASQAPSAAAVRWSVVLLCALVAFLDGFDTQAVGPAAKAISASLGVPLSAFGLVFSASQIGFVIGAMLFSTLGDRFGRKRLLVAATATFAVCSLATAVSDSLAVLLAARFIEGLGLGGASPNFVSLASEYSAPAQRARVVTSLWAAVPLGGMVAAFASSVMLPALGWRAIFIVGCAAPLALTLALVRFLPESREVTGTAAKAATQARPAPIAELFTQGRAGLTVWLWLASFMTWSGLIVMAFWTPALLQRAGQSGGVAASVLGLNNAGGVVGTILVAATLTRVRPHHALTAALALSGVFLAAMGWFSADAAKLALVATLAGFFASAAGGALLAVSAASYPQDARATGVGWALGVGRIGAVAAPAATGLLVARDWPVAEVYLAIAASFLLAAASVVMLTRASRPSLAPSSTSQNI